jgi:16S rRNA (cytidine1402-2'-O)-methyltransferase
MAGVLYVVATPIGNLEDISPRALQCLRDADEIYAEDTRHTRKLLGHFGISAQLQSLHEHNESARADRVVALVGDGKRVALVTDAGTPAVSDPGAKVVRAVADEGLAVSPLPGPSALAAALSVSGFSEAGCPVLFVGFLPVKGKARRTALDRAVAHEGVVVFYESPHRWRETFAELAAADAERKACACRELTKMYEEIRHGTVAELCAWADDNEPRGELTLVLAPVEREEVAADDATVDAALRRCLDAGLSARDASTAVAATLGLKKRRVYQRCQQLER